MQRARILFGHQFTQNAHQVAAHGAANAAVVHLDDLLLLVLYQQFVVDARFAELVFNHGNAVAMRLLEDVVEQCGFAAAQKAGEDGDRDQLAAHAATPSSTRSQDAKGSGRWAQP